MKKKRRYLIKDLVNNSNKKRMWYLRFLVEHVLEISVQDAVYNIVLITFFWWLTYSSRSLLDKIEISAPSSAC